MGGQQLPVDGLARGGPFISFGQYAADADHWKYPLLLKLAGHFISLLMNRSYFGLLFDSLRLSVESSTIEVMAIGWESTSL